MKPFDKEKARQLYNEAETGSDSLLQKLRNSKWTTLYLLGVVIAILYLAFS